MERYTAYQRRRLYACLYESHQCGQGYRNCHRYRQLYRHKNGELYHWQGEAGGSFHHRQAKHPYHLRAGIYPECRWWQREGRCHLGGHQQPRLCHCGQHRQGANHRRGRCGHHGHQSRGRKLQGNRSDIRFYHAESDPIGGYGIQDQSGNHLSDYGAG